MAQRRNDHVFHHNIRRVHVWNTENDPEKPVYHDLIIRLQDDLTPDAANSNVWTMLRLAEQLGVPLQYSPTKAIDNGIPNRFAKIMSIERDHVRNSGFRIEDYRQIQGAIVVIRRDGRRLQPQDVEVLAKFVGTQLPDIEYYAAPRAGNWRTLNEQKVADTSEQWKAVANAEAFAAWWFEWRDQAVADGYSDYADLICPVGGATRPTRPTHSEPKKSKGIAPRSKAKLKGKRCNVM